MGGLSPGSQGAGACLRLGGGVMHFRVELSMMAVTRVLIGFLLRNDGAWSGLGAARDSEREGLVKCAEARWEHAVVERDIPRPEILAPPPVTGDLKRKHNQILSSPSPKSGPLRPKPKPKAKSKIQIQVQLGLG